MPLLDRRLDRRLDREAYAQALAPIPPPTGAIPYEPAARRPVVAAIDIPVCGHRYPDGGICGSAWPEGHRIGRDHDFVTARVTLEEGT